MADFVPEREAAGAGGVAVEGVVDGERDAAEVREEGGVGGGAAAVYQRHRVSHLALHLLEDGVQLLQLQLRTGRPVAAVPHRRHLLQQAIHLQSRHLALSHLFVCSL